MQTLSYGNVSETNIRWFNSVIGVISEILPVLAVDIIFHQIDSHGKYMLSDYYCTHHVTAFIWFDTLQFWLYQPEGKRNGAWTEYGLYFYMVWSVRDLEQGRWSTAPPWTALCYSLAVGDERPDPLLWSILRPCSDSSTRLRDRAFWLDSIWSNTLPD